jgi:hypothetical protein
MYKHDPDAQVIEPKPKATTTEERMDALESKVTRLFEMMSALQVDTTSTRKAVRRQNTDIGNLSTALRSRG